MSDVSLPQSVQNPPTVEPFVRVTIAGHVHDLTPAGARVLADQIDNALREPLDTLAGNPLERMAAVGRRMNDEYPAPVYRSPAQYTTPSAE